MKSGAQNTSVVSVKKGEGDPRFIVSLVTFVPFSTIITGINLLRVTTKVATAYGRSLLN